MARTRCWGFHQWGKWRKKSYEVEHLRTGRTGVEYVQTRTCDRCGKAQEKMIF